MALKNKENAVQTVKKHIKDNTFSRVYLFYGDEVFLKNMYISKLKQAVYDGSFSEFNDIRIPEDASADDIDALLERYPVMSDKKFIYVKDSGIFKTKSKKKSTEDAPQNESSVSPLAEFWVEKLKGLPDFLTVVFDEKEVSAASSAYKAIAKSGTVLEFDFLSDEELLAWIQREFRAAHKKIDKNTAQYLINVCDKGMTPLKNEITKLINYCNDEVFISDIDKLASKSLEVRIFDVTNAITDGNVNAAIKILAEFKAQNLNPVQIFHLIFDAFDKMLHASLMVSNGSTYESIAAAIFPKQQPSRMTFMVRNYIKAANFFGEAFLTEQIINGAEIIYQMRHDGIDEWIALEEYVSECIYSKNPTKR